MSYKTMANPTVEVNNDVIAIVPGSLVFNIGYGETKNRIAAAGGSKEFYTSQDVTTQVGTVTFKLITAKKNVDLITDWVEKTKSNGNTITLADTNYTEEFSEMIVVNSPEISTGPDGEVEVKFEGRGSF
jgi:hypothetical protein